MQLFSSYPFTLPKLPYSYEALEPYISGETMHFHYDKHFNRIYYKIKWGFKGMPWISKLYIN